MACKFNVNDLETSLENLGDDLSNRASELIDSGIPDQLLKKEILRVIGEVSESHLINSENVEEAFAVFEEGILDDFDEGVIPTDEEIKSAMVAWTRTPDTEKEDTSTKRLDNLEKNVLRVNDDPIALAYGRALKAKIRAQQHVNTVGVHSILYTDEGIINGVHELNHAIELQQEQLLNNVLKYLQNNIPGFKYSDGKMYDGGYYTGIVESISSEYGLYLKFDFNELNNLYNNNQIDVLDAYSSWIILLNFDTILQKTFGKAISIDGNKSKYNIGKYSIAGGSNVYTTWRTNEEIDLSKEINNISLCIINSLPYYTADTATPTNKNLKFNEFVYIISKIKELSLHAKGDFVFSGEYKDILQNFSEKTKELFQDKSFFSVINTLRNNPLEYIPAIIEVLNNKEFFEILENNFLEEKYFASIDRDLINSLYQGLFSKDNPKSLIYIQGLGLGYQGVNYLSFITQTIDSIYKSNFLQYFRNSDGEIYVRNMYDLSLYNIEQTIKSSINRFNSTIIASNYSSIKEKYSPYDDVGDITSLNLENTILDLDGTNYALVVKNNQGTKEYSILNNDTKEPVTDPVILEKLHNLIKSKFAKPLLITYNIPNFHKGPLTVQMDLTTGKILYLLNGENISFHGKSDYDSLSEIIQDILKQNFDINPNYLEAYLNRLGSSNIDRYGFATEKLMQLVTRVIVNLYVLENYIKNVPNYLKKSRINEIYSGDLYKVTYNRELKEINFIGDSETGIIKDLAEANALVTGRLTSSQILDGEGNALASSTLSRLVNSLLYLVETLCKSKNSASKNFILWNPGVYKGVCQLKEFKDRSKNLSKNHILFSNKEMESSLVFVDFLQGLMNENSTKSVLTDGVVGFYPSENSDKTFVGRLLIDLKAVKIGETSLYNLLKENPKNITLFYPVIREQLSEFYNKALENINNDWKKVQDLVDQKIIEYNNKVLSGEINGHTIIREDISYGNWSVIKNLVNLENETRPDDDKITELQYVMQLVKEHNNRNPFNPIVLRDLVHYVASKSGELLVNNSFMSNLIRFNSQQEFESFINSQNLDVLTSLLKDEVSINADNNVRKILGNAWIDSYTNKVILAKYSDGTPIRRLKDFNPNRTDIILNPLIEAYNSLNYFFTQEYMNSSVGAYYVHPNKKHEEIWSKIEGGIIGREEALASMMKDEKARKLALDKRNVDFTAAMHSFLKGLIQGIPDEINVAIIPNSHDSYETIIGEEYSMDPDDGACYSNPFYQVLQNNSLGGAKVGLIKKTFTHFYDENTGTAGIFKDAEFPLTNEWIRRSSRYQRMMRNMSDRVWRNPDGSEAVVDILKDYNGNTIELVNPMCVRQGQLFFRDPSTGKYFAFWIKNGSSDNSYVRTVQEVDEYGMAKVYEDGSVAEMYDEKEVVIDTNYKLWNLLGGEYSMEVRPGNDKLTYSETSINTVVKIMNNTTSLNGPKLSDTIETQKDVWQPLKHSDIHLMPTVGAVKMGIANINTEKAFTESNPDEINFFRIKCNLMGVQLDKEHHADGEDLSIMTLVLSACAARGYTQEQCQELYNALSLLARAGMKPFIKNFELFFKVSSNPKASPEALQTARQNFENVLLDTLVKALANSKSMSSALQIVTSELLEKAKEGKEIDFANLKVPLSDPAVMKKLHSTISVALTRAVIKIKVDGSLNMLCPSYGIVKVYNGKMKNEFLSDIDIVRELERQDLNPQFELINDISRVKLGRTYKAVTKSGQVILLDLKHLSDYYNLRQNIGKYSSIREQFAPMDWTVKGEHTLTDPDVIRNEINNTRGIKKKLQRANELGLNIGNPDFFEPENLEEYISKNLPKITRASLKEELGYGDLDLNKFVDITKGGKLTLTQAAESIAGELMGTALETDTQTVRNIIIDLLGSASTSSDVYNYLEYNRINNALDEYENDYAQEEQEILELSKNHHFEGGRELGSYNVTFTGTINPVGQSSLIVTGNPGTTGRKAIEVGGIDALRHPDANGMHFGNPFSHLQNEVNSGRASVFMPTVREAVIAFDLWLKGEAYLDVEPERRKWIVDQINNGSLAGKPIVYYTNTIKDDEGFHYYNPETFPNHAQVLLRYINEKAKELAGPLFTQASAIEKGFNLYDLKSVKKLHDLKRNGGTKEQIDQAMFDLQSDLNILHSRHGEVETIDGIVTINPNSINIEPYEIVMPKIFATIFGLTTEDSLDSIKSDPLFFTRRLISNLNTIPRTTDGNLTFTIALQTINGKHNYILNSNDAVQTDNFKPKEIQKIRENGKLYRKIGDELAYELNENDQVWEYVDLNGNATEVIVTDNIYDYLNRLDFTTININTENSVEQQTEIINNLRKSNNNSVKNYIEMFDYLMETREGELLLSAIEDILDISINNYDDHPLASYFEKLGKQIHASFLKSLEVVAARVPAQSMLSFMPMKVVGFEGSDINTAYVSTAQILFQGSDYDIDAVSLASYSFDKSGRYIIHSPLANIESLELLKASLRIPFPTGQTLEINDEEQFDYNTIIRTKNKKTLDNELNSGVITQREYDLEMSKPFFMLSGGQLRVENNSVLSIDSLSKFIKYCNDNEFIPSPLDQLMSIVINSIRAFINRHNNYINTSKDVELFAKNFIVTAMYDIGISPANLIESLAALDYITAPLKEAANATLKAMEDTLDNPGNFTTNVHGLVQNMDGKQGVGICAVGLKGFFAATARYNEVLQNGNEKEVLRLKADVEIAGKHFRMLANAYTTNEVNRAILGEIITQLNQTNDAALVLSALLSLATDNAKELALSKLNAAKMLGMYIYGISIGMDFKEISKIICSKSGIIIDSLMKEDIFSGDSAMSMENIFDYIELGPSLRASKRIPSDINLKYATILNKEILRTIAWNGAATIGRTEYNFNIDSPVIGYDKVDYNKIIDFLESQKVNPPSDVTDEFYEGIVEFNNNIEKAQQYINHIQLIKSDQALIHGELRYYKGRLKGTIYDNLKKLYYGGEEMRRLGLLLHINQGNETSYSKALNFIDTVETAISSRQYQLYREKCRRYEKDGKPKPDDFSKNYEFNFHDFIFNESYREAVIDLYNGVCDEELFLNDKDYSRVFKKIYPKSTGTLKEQYDRISNLVGINSSKVFLNILDILKVPHYMEYIRSADMLHLYMSNSVKYRAIYKLGKRAILEIGAYSLKDRENIFKRTEQFVDRLIRDRFFISLNILIEIPENIDTFITEDRIIKRIPGKISPQKIRLGTREGNASFKLLMEEVIIPELLKLNEFKNNKFIQSLSPVLFGGNPEFLTTICYAPNINMSPRSDSDSALFEEIKHDFNKLRTTSFRYRLGQVNFDLIDLFYYYNLIAFGGKIGENTLTNIFQDVLDYNNVKNYRDFESKMDKEGNLELSDKKNGIEGTITLGTLIREVAPKANAYTTKLKYFYEEDSKTGELQFKRLLRHDERYLLNPITGQTVDTGKYTGSVVSYTSEEDYKNYIVQTSDSDIVGINFTIKGKGNVHMILEKGTISDITLDGVPIEIPLKDQAFFRNLKTISRITSNGVEIVYDKDNIMSKVDEIISCKI